jgi:hypothetical protein
MKYFILDPEVAGSLGFKTAMDTTVHPPTVASLHFVVDAWLGDDIVQSFPCYLVTEELKTRLKSIKPSGLTFAFAEITASDNFEELNHGRKLPELSWMKVTGAPGSDDVGLTADARLVVSERVLAEMKRLKFDHCDVKQFLG